MIEFRVVSGIWPRPASRAPVLKAAQSGTNVVGCQIRKDGRPLDPAMKKERTSPKMKITRAYGTFGVFWVRRSARKAKIAQIRLSATLGVVQPRGCRRVVPADRTRESPAPTWIPLTTGVGITCVNHRSMPVTLNMNTNPDVVKPADTVSSIENFLAIATAAIAFGVSVT